MLTQITIFKKYLVSAKKKKKKNRSYLIFVNQLEYSKYFKHHRGSRESFLSSPLLEPRLERD